MKRNNKYVVLLLLALGLISPLQINAEPAVVLEQPAITVTEEAIEVLPTTVVTSPDKYLNKTIKMTASFDKFSTLGLDYPPALRANSEYISFTVFRDDTTFDIPLSEMKLFLTKDEAQKFVELKAKEKVQIKGKVFSTALGDAWVDVLELKTIK